MYWDRNMNTPHGSLPGDWNQALMELGGCYLYLPKPKLRGLSGGPALPRENPAPVLSCRQKAQAKKPRRCLGFCQGRMESSWNCARAGSWVDYAVFRWKRVRVR